jgi:c-di-GMP-binding flagellar brake protein YcgR
VVEPSEKFKLVLDPDKQQKTQSSVVEPDREKFKLVLDPDKQQKTQSSVVDPDREKFKLVLDPDKQQKSQSSVVEHDISLSLFTYLTTVNSMEETPRLI